MLVDDKVTAIERTRARAPLCCRHRLVDAARIYDRPLDENLLEHLRVSCHVYDALLSYFCSRFMHGPDMI